MMKNFQRKYEDEDQNSMDPVVKCAWLPDREIRLSEYLDMVTYYVQNYIEKNSDAQPVSTKDFPD